MMSDSGRAKYEEVVKPWFRDHTYTCNFLSAKDHESALLLFFVEIILLFKDFLKESVESAVGSLLLLTVQLDQLPDPGVTHTNCYPASNDLAQLLSYQSYCSRWPLHEISPQWGRLEICKRSRMIFPELFTWSSKKTTGRNRSPDCVYATYSSLTCSISVQCRQCCDCCAQQRLRYLTTTLDCVKHSFLRELTS